MVTPATLRSMNLLVEDGIVVDHVVDCGLVDEHVVDGGLVDDHEVVALVGTASSGCWTCRRARSGLCSSLLATK
jgi:hypothetical protein